MKKIKYTIIFTLLIISIIYIYKAYNYSHNNSINNDEQLSLQTSPQITDFTNKSKSEIDNLLKNTIINFLNRFYNDTSNLTVSDYSDIFYNETDELITKSSLTLLSKIRNLQNDDLKMKNVIYMVEIEDLSYNDGIYTITMKEDYTGTFNFMTTPSKSYNISSVIKIADDSYKIISYEREEDYYLMITEISNNDKSSYEQLSQKLNNAIEKYLEIIKYQNEKYNNDLLEYNEKGVEYSKCDNEYDRTSAYEYAIKYVTERSKDFYDFGDLGGNCQNYASQVLLAGGIPMDTVGKETWKYYGTKSNLNNSKSGRSPSWAGVGDFYNYAKSNTGYGLCSVVDANIYSAKKGDIIQVSDEQESYAHTVVVIDTLENNGSVVDIIINSNTIDRENYPLKAYNYPYKRLIKILGWNN